MWGKKILDQRGIKGSGKDGAVVLFCTADEEVEAEEEHKGVAEEL